MESFGNESCHTSLNHFQFVYVILFCIDSTLWRNIQGLGALRHACHCFCFLADDSEVTSQEAKHAVGLFYNSVNMRFPTEVI